MLAKNCRQNKLYMEAQSQNNNEIDFENYTYSDDAGEILFSRILHPFRPPASRRNSFSWPWPDSSQASSSAGSAYCRPLHPPHHHRTALFLLLLEYRLAAAAAGSDSSRYLSRPLHYSRICTLYSIKNAEAALSLAMKRDWAYINLKLKSISHLLHKFYFWRIRKLYGIFIIMSIQIIFRNDNLSISHFFVSYKEFVETHIHYMIWDSLASLCFCVCGECWYDKSWFLASPLTQPAPAASKPGVSSLPDQCLALDSHLRIWETSYNIN